MSKRFAGRLRRQVTGEEGKSGQTEEGQGNGDQGKQLLGIRGAEKTTDKLRIRVQLTKPVTWVPLVWGVACGAAASGGYHWNVNDVAKGALTMVMSGPCLTGYTQTINDYFDKDIDAINEPDRPIPSGAITEGEVIAQIVALLAGGLGIAYGIDRWSAHELPTVLALAAFGSLVSLAYSAPGIKLKQNGFFGNYALGSSYIALPWLAGQAAFGDLTPESIAFTAFYSLAGFGIAIVNDFKAVEGDRSMGIRSIPVMFGIDAAKWICASSVDLTQIGVAAYLYWLGERTYAVVLLALVAPQIFFQARYLLADPIEYDVKYQGSSQPFLVFGLLTSGLALGDYLQKTVQ